MAEIRNAESEFLILSFSTTAPLRVLWSGIDFSLTGREIFPISKKSGGKSGTPISYKDLLRDFIKDMVLLWFAIVLL